MKRSPGAGRRQSQVQLCKSSFARVPRFFFTFSFLGFLCLLKEVLLPFTDTLLVLHFSCLPVKTCNLDRHRDESLCDVKMFLQKSWSMTASIFHSHWICAVGHRERPNFIFGFLKVLLYLFYFFIKENFIEHVNTAYQTFINFY